jgi:hypothetical protein
MHAGHVSPKPQLEVDHAVQKFARRLKRSGSCHARFEKWGFRARKSFRCEKSLCGPDVRRRQRATREPQATRPVASACQFFAKSGWWEAMRCLGNTEVMKHCVHRRGESAERVGPKNAGRTLLLMKAGSTLECRRQVCMKASSGSPNPTQPLREVGSVHCKVVACSPRFRRDASSEMEDHQDISTTWCQR